MGFQQVMDIIQKKISIKYHEVHIYRLLHKWGFKLKVPQKRFVRTASQRKRKRNLKKSVQKALIALKDDWNVLVQDESIFIYMIQ